MDLGGFFKGNKSRKSEQRIDSGAIPGLQHVMSATKKATNAFSGAGRHMSTSFRRLGMKATDPGLGCGIGADNAFGPGFAAKPGMAQRVQVFLVQAMANMMISAGIVPSLPSLSVPGITSGSLRRGISKIGEGRNLENDLKSLAVKATPSELLGSLPKKFISTNFLQNPVSENNEKTELNETAQSFHSENNILQMLMKHQRIIEELKKENDNLRRVLEQDFKVPRNKLQPVDETMNSCSDCFECRRRNRRSAS